MFRMKSLCFAMLMTALVLNPSFGQDESLLTQIAHSILANRQSFDQFTCHFEISFGLAAPGSSWDTIDLANMRSQCHATGLWMVDGPKALIDVKLKGKNLPTVRHDDNKVLHPFLPECYITDGSIELSINHLDIGHILPVDPENGSPNYTPFNLGVFERSERLSPWRLLKGGISGKPGKAKVREVRKATVIVDYSIPPLSAVFSFDPQRSFAVRDSEFYVEKTKFAACRFEDFKNCDEGKWFPLKGRSVRFADRLINNDCVLIMKVTQLALGVPDKLSVVIPEGVSINGPSGSWITTRGPQSLSVDELPNFLELVASRTGNSELPAVSRSSTWIYVLPSIIAASLAWMWISRRKSGR